jgi:hypothetical protein
LHIFGEPPNATQDVAYVYTPDVRGGLGPYEFAVVGGALPDGLDVDGETIAGTPTVAGSFSAFVQVTDANGVNSQTQLDFAVVP